MKKCSKCGVEKELNEFIRDKSKKDGLKYNCRVCCNNEKRERYRNNREKILEQNSNWRLNNMEIVRSIQKKLRRTTGGKYTQLKVSSKERRIEMRISFIQYTEIIKENKCFYCDASLVGSAGHSLNRIDNSKGYLVDNVKPCCRICNSIMNNFTKEELKNRVYKIIKRME